MKVGLYSCVKVVRSGAVSCECPFSNHIRLRNTKNVLDKKNQKKKKRNGAKNVAHLNWMETLQQGHTDY